MPSATFAEPYSPVDESSEVGFGSLEHLKSSEAFPKLKPQRVSSLGELQDHPCSSSVAVAAAAGNAANSAPAVLEPPFPLLPGEFVKQFGQIASGTQLVLTNYRLFVLLEHKRFYNVPLPSIDTVEARDMCGLSISCKDGRIIKLQADTSEICLMWFKLLTTIATGASKREELFAFAFHAWCTEEKRQFSLGLRHADAYDPTNLNPSELAQEHASLYSEYKRLEFCDTVWRITDRNANYKLCDTYPRFLIVPSWISDTDLEKCVKYRFHNRMPAIVWRDKRRGSVLLRSSQPALGVFGWRCPDDETYLQALLSASAKQPGPPASILLQAQTNGHCVSAQADSQNSLVNTKSMLILDARSYTAAWANRAKGGGFESPEYYQKCEVQFMGLANIHTIRSSFTQLRTLLGAETVDQSTWLQSLQSAQWLQHLSNLFSTAVQAVEALHNHGRSVLVHCSDGWDRTTQIISLAKLILDPFYRTMRGFRDLLEREWIEYGHKFVDRCGVLNRNPNERSPVFLQWLDCVHQLYTQFPGAFEFNQAYLVKLAHHAYSGLFGTFLCNSGQEAATLRVNQRTFSIWSYLHPDNAQFRNVIYECEDRVLWPEFQMKDLRLWKEVYCMSEPAGMPRPRSGSLQGSAGTGTSAMERSLKISHSCDSLTSVGGGGGSEANLVKTGSDSNLNSSTAMQPPQYPASFCSVATREQGSEEEVSFLIEQMVSRVSESETDEATTPRFGLNENAQSLEPLSFSVLQHQEAKADREEEKKQLGFFTSSECSFLNPEETTAEVGSTISTSTTDISDSLVRRPQLIPSVHSKLTNGYRTSSLTKVYEETKAMGESRLSRKRWKKRRNIADWLDSDGLNTLVDVQQERMREMQSHYKKVYEKMESEMQRMRLFLQQQKQQNGYTAYHNLTNGISVPGNEEVNKDFFEPNSVDSAASGLSDVSWEAVDEKDAQPTKWIPDHAVTHCMSCDAEFWAVNRKHHCRNCGKVFCSQCSKFECPVPAEQLYHKVRVCNTCYNILGALTEDVQVN